MKITNVVGKYRTGSWYQRNTQAITTITVHHDAIPQDSRSADQVMKSIQNIHQSKGWPGMSYHFYIHNDGSVYQVNDFSDITWHDSTNDDSIGVCVHGYFHTPHNEEPTEAQLASLKSLLDELSTQHPEFPAGQGDVYGHRERDQTACPGDNLFPYVKEYREKTGNVSWVVNEASEIQKLEAKIAELRTQRELYRKEIAELESKLNDVTDDRNRLAQDAARLQVRLNEALERHTEELKTKQDHIDSIQLTLSEVNQQHSALTNQYAKLSEENESNKATLSNAQQKFIRYEEELMGFENLVSTRDSEITKLKTEITKLKADRKKKLSEFPKRELLKALFS